MCESEGVSVCGNEVNDNIIEVISLGSVGTVRGNGASAVNADTIDTVGVSK
jgi:hypothetical protein